MESQIYGLPLGECNRSSACHQAPQQLESAVCKLGALQSKAQKSPLLGGCLSPFQHWTLQAWSLHSNAWFRDCEVDDEHLPPVCLSLATDPSCASPVSCVTLLVCSYEMSGDRRELPTSKTPDIISVFEIFIHIHMSCNMSSRFRTFSHLPKFANTILLGIVESFISPYCVFLAVLQPQAPKTINTPNVKNQNVATLAGVVTLLLAPPHQHLGYCADPTTNL